MSKGTHYFAAADERMASVLISIGSKTSLSLACFFVFVCVRVENGNNIKIVSR